MPRPQREAPATGTLAEHIAALGDPVDFVARRIHWTLARCPAGWRADLIDAALSDFVDACLAWGGEDSGYELGAYVTLRVQSHIGKRAADLADQRRLLGRSTCITDQDWRYRSSDADLDRALDRLDLQRWADLAELSPLMRWGVESYAVLGSPRDRGRWYDAARAGIRYMKIAAASNRIRDDHWTRARAQQRGDTDLELRRLYLDEGLTIREISDRTGMGGVTITRRLRAAGVTIRPPGHRAPNRPAYSRHRMPDARAQ